VKRYPSQIRGLECPDEIRSHNGVIGGVAGMASLYFPVCRNSLGKQEWNSIRAARVGRVVLAAGRKSQIVKRTIGQAGPIVALGASSGEERQKTVLLLCRERIELIRWRRRPAELCGHPETS